MVAPARIDIERQTIVSNAAAEALAADRPTPLSAGTRAKGEALVAAGFELRPFTMRTSNPTVAGLPSADASASRPPRGTPAT